MYRQSSEPFLAAHNDGRAHQMIVHNVCKVIGRDAVRLEDNDVLIVLSDLHLALYEVLVTDLVLDAALGTEADDIRRALGELCLDVLHRTVAPYGVFTVVAEVFLVLLLLSVRLGKLLLGAEAGIRHAALDERLDEGLVDLSALALAVGTVDAGLAVGGRALVERQTERLEGIDDHLHAAIDLTLAVGVLDAQIENALRLMRQTLVYERAVQIAEVHEARGARAHTGDLRAFGQVALRVARLDVLGRGIDMRKQSVRQKLVIHLLHSKLRYYTVRALFRPCGSDMRDSLAVVVVRVTLASLLMGSVTAFLFSLFGGLLALFVMWALLHAEGKFCSLLGVSVAGAAAHNIGQIAAAVLWMKTTAVLAYLPYLLLMSVPLGLVTGLVCAVVLTHMKKIDLHA